MTNGCFANITEEKVGEEGVRVVVTTALDPTGMLYLGNAGLGHLVCHTEMIPGGLIAAEALEVGCQVTPDPVGQGNPDACPWEFTTTPPTTPGQYVDKNDMLRAAVFVAAGADKFSPVTLDEVINVNNYLGVNPWTYTTVRKVKTLTIKYFPFTVNAAPAPGAWFKYARGEDACQPDTTAQLLTADDPTELAETEFTAMPVSVFDTSDPNHVDLDSIGITVCRNGSPLGGACESATDPYYGGTGVPNINGCGGANWFAQAAEDARKTIWYVHNWRVPELAY